MSANIIRILVTQDPSSKRWVAMCVDHCIVATSERQEDIMKAFGHVYFGEILVSMERGVPVSFAAAPGEASRLWDETVKKDPSTKYVPASDLLPDWWPDAIAKLNGTRVPQPDAVVARAAA